MSKSYENCTCIGATGKAILVERKDKLKAWIPISQLHESSEIKEHNNAGKFIVTKWWSEKLVWQLHPKILKEQYLTDSYKRQYYDMPIVSSVNSQKTKLGLWGNRRKRKK